MKLIRFFMPRLEYILFAALIWGLASTGPILLNSDGDLPRHILVGQLIRATHEVHTTDIFSFRTAGFPSIPHEWLAQVIISGFYDVLGLSGVVLYTVLIVTAAWVIIFKEALRRSGSLLLSILLTGLGVGASLIHILPRPHLFSYLFAAVWILVLEQIQSAKPKRWWLLPALMFVWVNLHGMFVLGIVIWVIYLVGSFFENPTRAWLGSPGTKAMLAGGGLAFLATFFSPSSFKIWEAIASLGGNAYITSRIPEYQSANFHMAETWPFILLLLICLLSFARSTTRIPWTYAFLVTAFAGVALYSSRMLPFFAIVSVPVVAQTLSAWLKQDFPQSRFLQVEANLTAINNSSDGLIWIIAVIFGVTILFRANVPIDPQSKGNNFDPKFFPVQAADWLITHPQSGHVFNEFDWGGYLLLRLWPSQQIFMDGHTHIYGEALTREYEQVITLSMGWETIFEKYQVAWVIVRAESPLVSVLEESGWQTLYSDETAIILRSSGE